MTTPRPWTREWLNYTRATDSEPLKEPIIVGPSGNAVAGPRCLMTDENADLIVRAVNAHDALVTALEKAEMYVEAAQRVKPDEWVHHAVREEIRAALRAARGEE